MGNMAEAQKHFVERNNLSQKKTLHMVYNEFLDKTNSMYYGKIRTMGLWQLTSRRHKESFWGHGNVYILTGVLFAWMYILIKTQNCHDICAFHLM